MSSTFNRYLWTVKQKKQLRNALLEYPAEAYLSIARRVRGKDEQDVKEFIAKMKMEIKNKEENKWVKKEVVNRAPLEEWLDISRELVEHEPVDSSTNLIKAMSVISQFEDQPSSEKDQRPDYKMIYKYLSQILQTDRREDIITLGKLESAVVLDLLHSLMEVLGERDTTVQYNVMRWKYQLMNSRTAVAGHRVPELLKMASENDYSLFVEDLKAKREKDMERERIYMARRVTEDKSAKSCTPKPSTSKTACLSSADQVSKSGSSSRLQVLIQSPKTGSPKLVSLLAPFPYVATTLNESSHNVPSVAPPTSVLTPSGMKSSIPSSLAPVVSSVSLLTSSVSSRTLVATPTATSQSSVLVTASSDIKSSIQNRLAPLTLSSVLSSSSVAPAVSSKHLQNSPVSTSQIPLTSEATPQLPIAPPISGSTSTSLTPSTSVVIHTERSQPSVNAQILTPSTPMATNTSLLSKSTQKVYSAGKSALHTVFQTPKRAPPEELNSEVTKRRHKPGRKGAMDPPETPRTEIYLVMPPKGVEIVNYNPRAKKAQNERDDGKYKALDQEEELISNDLTREITYDVHRSELAQFQQKPSAKVVAAKEFRKRALEEDEKNCTRIMGLSKSNKDGNEEAQVKKPKLYSLNPFCLPVSLLDLDNK